MARHQCDSNKREGEECSSPVSPLCNPVSSFRLQTLILTESVREMGERRGRQTETGEWDHYL